ncbi:SNF2 family helicase [Mycena chlorophos]|uniref:SNF2 family helicase n=1 Tax=Mycena chlorophos TaxID=658473 RepID=A0A8H6RZ29_MYCCL|nr:SNF2 family helicase [Mycena chlorophos]
MARFAAFTDDSSDDEPSPEKLPVQRLPSESPEEDRSDDDDDDLSPSPSESGSDLHEDDLVPRNALVQDKNGDFQYANQVAPPLHEPVWAQRVGVDPQKMHVMQASLFRVPEETAAMRAQTSLQVPLPLNRKHSRDSDGEGLRFEPGQRASFAHDVDPPAFRPTRKYARVEKAESAVVDGEAAVVDAGLAFGRSFRVGWGTGGVLVHPGAICGPHASISTSANSSVISKTTAPAADSGDLCAKLLQHQLSHSPIDLDDDEVPFANPSSTDLHFSSFAALFPPTDRSFEASLFRLGSALFDALQLRLGDSVTPDIRTRVIALRRKAALSAWLEDAVAPTVEFDIRAKPSAGPAALAFLHLTGNQVARATEVAVDGGHLKLATLISQAGGDLEFRADLRLQLDIWREQRVDLHVDDDVRKVYALLSGLLESVEGSTGSSSQDKASDIDIVAGLDWKRVFGLHLWFSELVDAPISQVFNAYTEFIKDSSRKVSAPIPWYSESSSRSQSRWKLSSLAAAPDALAQPPLSFGPSPLDYSLPWHLYIILSRCMRVRDFSDRGDPGTRRTSPTSSHDGVEDPMVEGHSPSADLLTSSYAFQLEQQGMIQEAVFVLLHIEGSAGRAKVIKDLLARNASRLDEWTTRGIVGSLHVPMTWVHEAKAIYALNSGDVYEAYELYASAELYDESHDLAISKLAPDAIIRNDLELLSSLFSRFVRRKDRVRSWHSRGKALLDYATVATRLPVLDEEMEHIQSAAELMAKEEERDELTRTAAKLIGILPEVLDDRTDLRQNAALATMISTLVALVDRVLPVGMVPSHVDESVKLQHLQALSIHKFVV